MLGAVTEPSVNPSLSESSGVSPPATIIDLIGSPIDPSANRSIFFLVSKAPNSAEDILTEMEVCAVAKKDPSERLNSHCLYAGEKLEPELQALKHHLDCDDVENGLETLVRLVAEFEPEGRLVDTIHVARNVKSS